MDWDAVARCSSRPSWARLTGPCLVGVEVDTGFLPGAFQLYSEWFHGGAFVLALATPVSSQQYHRADVSITAHAPSCRLCRGGGGCIGDGGGGHGGDCPGGDSAPPTQPHPASNSRPVLADPLLRRAGGTQGKRKAGKKLQEKLVTCGPHLFFGGDDFLCRQIGQQDPHTCPLRRLCGQIHP